MSDTKLLPCPFCGSHDVHEDGAGVYNQPKTFSVWVVCHRCGGSGPCRSPDEEQSAANDWNQRTPPEGYVLVPVNNIISVERTSDQSVLVGFSSCRAASVFEGLMPEVK